MSLSSIGFRNLQTVIWSSIYFSFKAVGSVVDAPVFLRTLWHSSILESRYFAPDAFALITGATDGIGKGVAEEIAYQGWNIILHGRSPSKLNTFVEALRKRYPEQTFLGFTQESSARDPDLSAAFTGMAFETPTPRITLLVNNVGGAFDPAPAGHLTGMQIDDIVGTNLLFTIKLTNYLLSPMSAAPLDLQNSCILNISSIASRYPNPDIGMYSLSKSGLEMWSECLHKKMLQLGGGVEVLLVQVVAVQTNALRIRQPTLMVPSSRAFGRALTEKVGLGRKGIAVVWPWLPHQMFSWFLDCLPRNTAARLWEIYLASFMKYVGSGKKE